MARKVSADTRRRIGEARRREWADPELRHKRTEGVRRSWERLTPEQRRERMAKVRAGHDRKGKAQ